MIVWLTVDKDRPPETELTSVALPILPHCSFITNKAIRHIPPNIIIPAVNYYALQENLFHEATHQQLSATLIFEEILTTDGPPPEVIEIPWRKTRWPVDRALHAAWVYRKVSSMRKDEIERGPEGGKAVEVVLSQALDEGERALIYLLKALEPHYGAFTSRGQEILEQAAVP
jgi:hypothetical protein